MLPLVRKPTLTDRRTDFRHFSLGLIAAAATGAGVVSLPFLIGGPVAILAFLFAVPIWGVGLMVLGAPIWFALSAFGIRSRGAATLLGAVLSGGVVLAIDRSGLGLVIAMLVALAGMLAAFAGWGVAYRTAVPPREHQINEVFG